MLAVYLVSVALPLNSSLSLPTFIANSMALQREPIAARLWGCGEGGKHISVILDGEAAATTTVTVNGTWVLDLPPQPASVNRTIKISDGSDAITLTDVAFGDIYLCSGQSNMEMSVNNAFNASAEIAASKNFPHIRLATVARAVAGTPQAHAKSKANYTWARASPKAFSPVGGAPFSWFSAACWYFGRDLATALGGSVPIGLVASDWGGQTVEAFSSPAALADTTCGGTKPAISDGEEGMGGEPPPPPKDTAFTPDPPDYYVPRDFEPPTDAPNPGPTQLWNAMIHPLLPMRFVGATWYQGEANAANPSSYACRFPAMIADWRAHFGLPSLSFVFVQLAAYARQSFVAIRMAQTNALKLPLVGFATAVDLGDPTSPFTSIHPRRKQEVGRRMSLSMLTIQYGRRDIVSQGPTPSGAVQLTPAGQALVGFAAGTADGLHFNGSAACTKCCAVSPFETMDGASKWTRATASINARLGAGTVSLSSDGGAPIVGIRLMWDAYPECALYNGVGDGDSHTAIAAPPFQWCAFGTVLNGPSWEASCEPHDPNDVYYPGATVRSAAFTDFSLSGGAGLAGHGRADPECSGANIRTGGPGAVGEIRSRHAIVGSGHVLDGVDFAFRYIAGYTPAKGQTKRASVVTAQLTDSAGQVLRTLGVTPPLGNYSYDRFVRFSPPVPIRADGLNLTHAGGVYLTLSIANNERNLQIPVDDLAGGWNVTIRWK